MKRISEIAGPRNVVGRIVKVEAVAVSDRLKSMGIFDGQTVNITRLGANCLLAVAGARVAVGDELAGAIWVELVGDASVGGEAARSDPGSPAHHHEGTN
ncbi:MAG: FeoA family protein [Planctomycetota bacterium]